MSGSQKERETVERGSGIAEELSSKRPYVKPDLLVHGTVERITENTSHGPDDDGGMGSNQYYSR